MFWFSPSLSILGFHMQASPKVDYWAGRAVAHSTFKREMGQEFQNSRSVALISNGILASRRGTNLPTSPGLGINSWRKIAFGSSLTSLCLRGIFPSGCDAMSAPTAGLRFSAWSGELPSRAGDWTRESPRYPVSSYDDRRRSWRDHLRCVYTGSGSEKSALTRIGPCK